VFCLPERLRRVRRHVTWNLLLGFAECIGDEGDSEGEEEGQTKFGKRQVVVNSTSHRSSATRFVGQFPVHCINFGRHPSQLQADFVSLSCSGRVVC
jgi:hypothetical protein